MLKKIILKCKHKVKRAYCAYIQPLLLSKGKENVECPFCGWRGDEFLTFGATARKNALCPKCDSLERHRLYYLYLRKIIPQNKKFKVLHFAPETILTNLFKSYKNIEYLSADIDSRKAMIKEDITNTSFLDNSFDIIFCSHVLEHIQDDKKAMKELHRILKPNGFAILQVPIKDKFKGKKIDQTFEDSSIIDPQEREKIFGQKDHVRVYGRDYKNRLINSGFKVEINKFTSSLEESVVSKYALLPTKNHVETEGWIYFCTK